MPPPYISWLRRADRVARDQLAALRSVTRFIVTKPANEGGAAASSPALLDFRWCRGWVDRRSLGGPRRG